MRSYKVTPIWNYGSPRRARREFQRFLLDEADLEKVTATPDFISKHADQFVAYCRYKEPSHPTDPPDRWIQCNYFARYGPYVTAFGGSIGSEFDMSFDEFELLLEVIDARMGRVIAD